MESATEIEIRATTPEPSDADIEQQATVEKLAYALWQYRGAPIGSPEEDWLEAERQLSKSGPGPSLSTPTGGR